MVHLTMNHINAPALWIFCEIHADGTKRAQPAGKSPESSEDKSRESSKETSGESSQDLEGKGVWGQGLQAGCALVCALAAERVKKKR